MTAGRRRRRFSLEKLGGTSVDRVVRSRRKARFKHRFAIVSTLNSSICRITLLLSPRGDIRELRYRQLRQHYGIATDCKFLPGIVDVKTDLRDSIGRSTLCSSR